MGRIKDEFLRLSTVTKTCVVLGFLFLSISIVYNFLMERGSVPDGVFGFVVNGLLFAIGASLIYFPIKVKSQQKDLELSEPEITYKEPGSK